MTYTLDFSQISAKDLPKVGGKGANLGEMSRAGFPIPPGFCVTVAGFEQFIKRADQAQGYYQKLAKLATDDLEGVRKLGGAFRNYLKTISIPTDVAASVVSAWETHGSEHVYAVRSSATAEDLPSASFAGQQDTYLNIRGKAEILESVRDCWISLFTDRAILYRAQNNFAHEEVQLSVVIQRMVLPQTSGIMFTADPISGHRQIISIDASFGLGEALVAGLVTPDLYKVDKRNWEIVESTIADKQLAIWPIAEGGTVQEELTEPQRSSKALTDAQIIALAKISKRIEDHYRSPQDIEWAIDRDEIFIVQSRPITSLFPLPYDYIQKGSRSYLSVNHAQVMTDPISPAGISLWRALLPFGKENPRKGDNPYITYAGGRIYADISAMLYTRIGRKALPSVMMVADELIGLALKELSSREDFEYTKALIPDKAKLRHLLGMLGPFVLQSMKNLWFLPPDQARFTLDAHIQYAIQRSNATREFESLPERLHANRAYQQSAFTAEALLIIPYIMTAMMSLVMLQRLLGKHADPKDLSAIQSGMIGNVTTEMDLAVGDLADIARKNTVLMQAFEDTAPKELFALLPTLEGSTEFLTAFEGFLQKYGMRGPAEIDLARTRWRDDPTPILQIIRGNLQNPVSGQHRVHFDQLTRQANVAGARLIAVARSLPLGRLKARLTTRWLTVFRNYMPLREHPKYMLVQFIETTRQIMLEAAGELLKQGRIDQLEDIWFLPYDEIIAAIESPELEVRTQIAQRQQDYAHYAKLTPPRVMTSEGEIIRVRRSMENLPEGALPGSPVSAGVVEGLARVMMDPSTETLYPGEILVAPHTDPAWTPLFINAAGVVIEVGGLMTHGSVVAREYGIPAVVSVQEATSLIQTGQRIRVNGDEGFVEILE